MASFTDKIVGFNPYIPEVPVDDYVRVGMIKQQQYDQGVQKVQGYIDSVAGIEAIKPEQKEYVHERVNQLQGSISDVLSQDFSNQQLVNSVGNLTGKMVADPIIQSTIQSTSNYKQGLAHMKEAQEKGQSSPSNEWDFHNQVSKWLGDKDVTSTFSGQYTPHTDVDKKVLAVIKELKPDSNLEQIPYSRGAGGQILLDKDGLPSIDYAMMQKEMKGVSPEKIHAAIQATLDPNDLRQLQIDGAYNYRGYDKSALKGLTDQSYTYRLDQINSSIKGLMVDRQTNTSDPNHIKQVDGEIDRLKDKAHAYQESYKRDIGSLDKDPDAFKSNLYMENWMSKFDEGFSYSENSLKYEKNPFFDAAERKREVDIKYQEFQMNKELGYAKLGIEQAKLGIEEQKMEIERQKLRILLKKGKIGDGEGSLSLTGADVREPIQQGDLAAVTVDNFVKETNDLSKNIDTQKMSLLAQVRPDLVHVVRDASGQNPHYEYNVAGKDPIQVKSEAEATVLKLKDSYDKGQTVDDGAKTYFDNLANTSLKVENRKTALNKLQADADATHNVSGYLSRIAPLKLHSSGGNDYTFSPEDMLTFNDKLAQVHPQSTSGYGGAMMSTTNLDDDKAQQLFTSQKEKFLYSVYRKGYYGGNLNQVEQNAMDTLSKVNRTVPDNVKAIKDAKDQYANNAVRDIVGATQPTSFPIESFKPEDKGNIRSVLGDLFNSTVAAKKENTSPYYDQGDISKMIDDEKNTTYSLVAKGGDRYSLRLTNTKITDQPREMDITKNQAQDLFGAGQFLDDFQAIREALQLTKGTGKVTTDVQGLGRESAFTLRTNNITNYGVKYHVEDPLKNGGLQVRLYIYDKAAKEWTEKQASFGQLLDEAQVTKMLSNLTDQEIDGLLGKSK